MESKNTLYLGVSSLLTILLISVDLHATWASPNIYSDLTGSFWGRDWVQAGTLPYLTSSFEYPPVSGLILYAARLIGSSFQGYYDVFSAFSLVAGIVVAVACYKIVKLSGRDLNPFYFILPSFLIYGIYNFDLFHAMFVMLSLLTLMTKRWKLSAVFLGIAVSTQLASVVLLPLFLMEIVPSGGLSTLVEPMDVISRVKAFLTHGRIAYIAVFGAMVGAFNLPFAALNLHRLLAGYQFIGNWGLEDAWYVWIFQDPGTWVYAKLFGLGLAVLLLLRVYTLKLDVLSKTFLALAAYLMGTFIYSPQFNLLLLPVVAVLDLDSPAVFLWDGFNALIILTWFIQPNPTLAGTWPQYFALLRMICLTWLALEVAARAGVKRGALLPFLKWDRGGHEGGTATGLPKPVSQQ